MSEVAITSSLCDSRHNTVFLDAVSQAAYGGSHREPGGPPGVVSFLTAVHCGLSQDAAGGTGGHVVRGPGPHPLRERARNRVPSWPCICSRDPSCRSSPPCTCSGHAHLLTVPKMQNRATSWSVTSCALPGTHSLEVTPSLQGPPPLHADLRLCPPPCAPEGLGRPHHRAGRRGCRR